MAGHGLEGDRYFFADGAGSGEALTLIEAEAIEDVGLTSTRSRRQVVVRGGGLDEQPGRQALPRRRRRMRRRQAVQKCRHLQKLTRPGIINGPVTVPPLPGVSWPQCGTTCFGGYVF